MLWWFSSIPGMIPKSAANSGNHGLLFSPRSSFGTLWASTEILSLSRQQGKFRGKASFCAKWDQESIVISHKTSGRFAPLLSPEELLTPRSSHRESRRQRFVQHQSEVLLATFCSEIGLMCATIFDVATSGPSRYNHVLARLHTRSKFTWPLPFVPELGLRAMM